MNQLITIDRDFAPHWKEEQKNEDYHADKSAVSSSGLRQIEKSPATFYQNFFLRLPEAEKKSKAKTIGTLCHQAILEGSKFLENFVLMPDFGDMRSSKNREARDEWLATVEGKTVVKQDELDVIKGTIEAIVNHEGAFNLLKDGKTEISGYYADPETGILCRIRPDFLSFNLMALVDVKTTIDCSREGFAKSIWNYRYDFQLAMYSEGIKQITGKEVDYPAFIAVEKEPPYEVAVYIADKEMIDKGREDYRKSLLTLKACLDTDTFPKYQSKIEEISLPRWAFTN